MLAVFAPHQKKNNKDQNINLYSRVVIILLIMLLFMIAGAIVGDNLNKLFITK